MKVWELFHPRTTQHQIDEAVLQNALAVIKQLLGTPSITATSQIDDDVFDTAKEETKQFINSAAGSWTVRLFKSSPRFGSKTFVKLDPPRTQSTLTKPTFYVPGNTK